MGGREKRLHIVDLLRIAQKARRAAVDEVAAAMLEATGAEHPELVGYVRDQLDRYFGSVHPATPPVEGFLEEIRSEFPVEVAEQVERIYGRYSSSK